MANIRNLKYNLRLEYTKKVCDLLQNDNRIINTLNDIKYHFRTKNYTLGYQQHLEMSGVVIMDIFNIALDLEGFKIVYNKETKSLGIQAK